MSLTLPDFSLLIWDKAGMFMVSVLWKCSKLTMSWCSCKFTWPYGCGVFMVILYVAFWWNSDLRDDVVANHQPSFALWVTTGYEEEWRSMKSKKHPKLQTHQEQTKRWGKRSLFTCFILISLFLIPVGKQQQKSNMTVNTVQVFLTVQVQCKCKAVYFSFLKFLAISDNPWHI